MKENLTYKKAFVFAKEIVILYKYLVEEKRNTLFQNKFLDQEQV